MSVLIELTEPNLLGARPLAAYPKGRRRELLPVSLEELEGLVGEVVIASRSLQTRRRYEGIWRLYLDFCQTHGFCPLPATPRTVLLFLAAYGMDRRTGSVRTARCSIKHHHLGADAPDPTNDAKVALFVSGHARSTGTPPIRKRPLLTEDIRELCALLDREGGAAAIRDKALILLGFAAALRTSEALQIVGPHLSFDHRGLTLLIPGSKTDQERKGVHQPVVRTSTDGTDPVAAVEAWVKELVRRGADHGPLFPKLRAVGDRTKGDVTIGDCSLSPGGYRAVLKARCKQIGLDPAEIGGHSLRAGHATQAAENGAGILEIAHGGRWLSLQTVQAYVRFGARFNSSSSGKLDL